MDRRGVLRIRSKRGCILTSEEALLFFTKPEELARKHDRLKELLDEIRADKTGLRGIDYTRTGNRTGRHDGQEVRILNYMEDTEALRVAILEATIAKYEALDEMADALDDLAPFMDAESYQYLLRKYYFGDKGRINRTTKAAALEDFARAYTERKEGNT